MSVCFCTFPVATLPAEGHLGDSVPLPVWGAPEAHWQAVFDTTFLGIQWQVAVPTIQHCCTACIATKLKFREYTFKIWLYRGTGDFFFFFFSRICRYTINIASTCTCVYMYMETFTYVRTCGNASAAETVIFSSQCSVHSFTNIHSLPYAQITICRAPTTPTAAASSLANCTYTHAHT